jgi:hypothetical protein
VKDITTKFEGFVLNEVDGLYLLASLGIREHISCHALLPILSVCGVSVLRQMLPYSTSKPSLRDPLGESSLADSIVQTMSSSSSSTMVSL